MKKIKAGVIGVGFIGVAHIEAIRRLGNAEVAAIADSNDEILSSVAQRLGIDNYNTDYRIMLKDPDIDVIHICIPNNLHYQITKEAILAGKHIVGEKPITTNIKDAEDLVRLAADNDIVNAIDFNIRYYPLIRQLNLMVKNNELGNIFSVHGSYLQDWLFYETDYSWRLEKEMAGKSRAVADIGSHWMDVMEFVSGQKIVEVFADFATFHKTRKKPLKPVETYTGKIETQNEFIEIDIDTEDYATVMFRLSNGGRGVFTVSQVSAGRKNRIFLEIAGSKKSAAWESELPNQMWIGKREAANELLLKDPSLLYPETRDIIAFPGGHNEGHPDSFKMLFKEIYNDINLPKDKRMLSYPSFIDGLREIQLCEKIIGSNEKGSWVKV